MRKILSTVVVAGFLAALGGVAEAKDMTNMKGLGWYNLDAPIGGIIWFSPKMAVTAGIGWDSFDDGNDETEEDTQINIAGALPIVLAGGDDVNFMFRPGIVYMSNPSSGFDSSFEVDLDLAVEMWLTSRASILAGSGVHFLSESPEEGDSQTSIGTHPISFTRVGFYYYFVK